MGDVYITRDGDMVDAIAFERYGNHGSEAAIFAANPGLADHGPILPAGLTIKLPMTATPVVVATKKLWGQS
jgi:phage tail protein X